MDSIGTVYDWNLIFDAMPENVVTIGYRVAVLVVTIGLWIWSEKREKES